MQFLSRDPSTGPFGFRIQIIIHNFYTASTTNELKSGLTSMTWMLAKSSIRIPILFDDYQCVYHNKEIIWLKNKKNLYFMSIWLWKGKNLTKSPKRASLEGSLNISWIIKFRYVTIKIYKTILSFPDLAALLYHLWLNELAKSKVHKLFSKNLEPRLNDELST